jgi:hypothetical protein
MPLRRTPPTSRTRAARAAGTSLLVLVALAAAAACDRGVRFERAAADSSGRVGAEDEPPLRAARAVEPPLGPGDARVASTDSAVVLTLRGDSVRMRLGAVLADSIRRTVRSAVDSAVGGDGAVARVATRLATRMADQVAGGALAVAVADIRRVTATDSTLRIETRGGGDFDVRGTRDDDRRDRRAEFAPGELPRFAAAVEARRRAPGGRGGGGTAP